jgi:hypothetical protein
MSEISNELHDYVEDLEVQASDAFEQYPDIDFVDFAIAHDNGKFYNIRMVKKTVTIVDYCMAEEISADAYLDAINGVE